MIGFASQEIEGLTVWFFYMAPESVSEFFISSLAVWMPINLSAYLAFWCYSVYVQGMKPYSGQPRGIANPFAKHTVPVGLITMSIITILALPIIILYVVLGLFEE